MKINIEKIGTFGLLITILTSPCCFPLFGFVLTALGIGSFELFGASTMYVFQALTLLSLVGLFFSYRVHRCMWPLLISVPGVLLIFYSYYFIDADYWTTFLYIGMFTMLLASGVDYYRNRLHKKNKAVEIQLQSIITCPVCGNSKEETMPTDACQYFYVCERCQSRLKPKEGDCCVFCSYGTVKCPPIQMGENCC